MELPKSSKNIFPLSQENFTTLLDHYFPKVAAKERTESLRQWLEEKRGLNFSLNQIEFGARFCRENEVLLDICSFSHIPAARIKFVLMSLFLPIDEWDKMTSRSYREELRAFRMMLGYQSNLLKKVDTTGFSDCVFPKTEKNLTAILDEYFSESSKKERELSLVQFGSSRESLGYINYAAQFCKENKAFLDRAGASSIPSQRIHEVVTAIFYPSYRWLPLEFEKNGGWYKELKNLYLEHIYVSHEVS